MVSRTGRAELQLKRGSNATGIIRATVAVIEKTDYSLMEGARFSRT